MTKKTTQGSPRPPAPNSGGFRDEGQADLSGPRWIERGDFPLRETSLDSVHEKNVRHGHISTLHIWPARRPLAASRAALIATLLPAPAEESERKRWRKLLGGEIHTKIVKDKDGFPKTLDYTVGGILHWGQEGGPGLDEFRERIRAAYGRAPRVLDPFAGGGAIPLEAMRLGCDVTAADINPVAWFILRCTLEYPQRLAGQTQPLPEFIRRDPDFMESFLKSRGLKGKPLAVEMTRLGLGASDDPPITGLEGEAVTLDADLAWHVRAWGQWVLGRARADLSRFYPTVGGHPTVAYLWARTVPCKDCGRELPLLKTRWLCKKDKKRVLLQMAADPRQRQVSFDILTNVPAGGGASKESRREHDKRIGAGTMSKSGATCPFCQTVNTREDLRTAGMTGTLGARMTAVVVDVPYKTGDRAAGVARGKAYRLPTDEELQLAQAAAAALPALYADIPFGLPTEPTPKGGNGAARAFSVDGYGIDEWQKLFTPRQLLALGTFVKTTRTVHDEMCQLGYPPEWAEAVTALLSICVDKVGQFGCTSARWFIHREGVCPIFSGFRMEVVWDFVECNPTTDGTGTWQSSVDYLQKNIDFICAAAYGPKPVVNTASATYPLGADFDAIITDPPYYDAIPYSDLMDFFYVWLRRTLHGLSPEYDHAFREPLAPKWDADANDGELIDDASRFGGDKQKSKTNYEQGMARAFQACHAALTPEGRLVVVFAHKQPDAWETLVTAIIQAGFVVDASWPIQTEMGNRTRAQSSAALSSSVWLVCQKRKPDAKPGWDNTVLDQINDNVKKRLREFWAAGIHGPDFVWAATGPALEAYSRYPIVRKANAPGERLGVSEFLTHARRVVLEFSFGAVFEQFDTDRVGDLDPATMYYLLHRKEFGMGDVPASSCSLYAVPLGTHEGDLVEQDLLERGKAARPVAEDDEEAVVDSDDTGDALEDGGEMESGSQMRLKPWHRRVRPQMGYDVAMDKYKARKKAAGPTLFDTVDAGVAGAAPRSRPVPLIDQVHRLMHLRKAGESEGVLQDYIELRGLRRNEVFSQVVQALIELAGEGTEERAQLERVQNLVRG